MSTLPEYPPNDRPRIYHRECGPSLAKQASKDECDINQIMAKYAKTGVLDHLNEHQGDYGDFSDAKDFLESQIIVQDAKNMFDTIPSGIRKQFNNSPAEFLEFVQNPDNLEEMIDLGLATRTPTINPAKETDAPDGSGSPRDPATKKTPAAPKPDAADSPST